MDNTLGAATRRKAQRRRQMVIGLVLLLVIGGLVSHLISTGAIRGRGPVDIVTGPGVKLETVFVGPPELEVVWEQVVGHAWSVSLVEGRIRNISSMTVTFKGITYSVKDANGNVIWEATDPRYIMGGKIEPLGSIRFVSHPISGREARIFELLVKDAQVLER